MERKWKEESEGKEAQEKECDGRQDCHLVFVRDCAVVDVHKFPIKSVYHVSASTLRCDVVGRVQEKFKQSFSQLFTGCGPAGRRRASPQTPFTEIPLRDVTATGAAGTSVFDRHHWRRRQYGAADRQRFQLVARTSTGGVRTSCDWRSSSTTTTTSTSLLGTTTTLRGARHVLQRHAEASIAE